MNILIIVFKIKIKFLLFLSALAFETNSIGNTNYTRCQWTPITWHVSYYKCIMPNIHSNDDITYKYIFILASKLNDINFNVLASYDIMYSKIFIKRQHDVIIIIIKYIFHSFNK